MYNRVSQVVTMSPPVRNGLRDLAAAAAAVYGNGRLVQYQDATGTSRVTCNFRVLLQSARPINRDAACALAAFNQATLPQDGVKTAVILLAAATKRFSAIGGTAKDLVDIADLLDYGAIYLERVAHETDGQLLGGALPYMTLIRPIVKHARDHDCLRAADVLSYALVRPLLCLAEAAGDDGAAVYERVKALAPNQFFSLHQVGIARSISTDTPYTDILTMGYDPTDGCIKDCRETAYRENLADIQQVLHFVKTTLNTLYNIAAHI